MLNKWSSIVKPDVLAGALHEPNLVILDCRFSLQVPSAGYEAYQMSHIPGAHYLSLDNDLSASPMEHGGRHPLPTVQSLEHLCTDLGISEDTQVVVYDDQRFAFAARCWWMLRAFGHASVSVLDGGFSNYQSLGFPCSNQEEARPQSLSSERLGLQASMTSTVTLDFVRSKVQPGALIDSRHPDRFAGLKEPIDPVAGHIPGAVNYFWQQVTDEKGWLRSPQELRKHFAAIADRDDLVVYCGSGVTACVNLLALEIAGIQGAKLYPGSWSDWCSYPLNEAWEIIED